MRDIPAALASHLASGTTTLCRCWRLTRRDGTVLGFTDHDRDLTFDGVTYLAASGLQPSEAEQQLGLAVSSGEVAGALSAEALNETDIAAGLYDDAGVTTTLVNWADVSQRLLLSAATIGEIRRTEGGFTAELRGVMHRYDEERGRLYQDDCAADLGDARCGIDLQPLTRTVTVTAAEGRAALVCAGLAEPEGWYAGGRLTLLTGPNAGQIRMVQASDADGRIVLWQPFMAPVSVGDTARLVPGCDKRFETCAAKFANTVNYRGFPHIPTPDFILTYARPGEGGHDGGALDP